MSSIVVTDPRYCNEEFLQALVSEQRKQGNQLSHLSRVSPQGALEEGFTAYFTPVTH